MGTTVDSLDIQLQMQATKANNALDTLITKLGVLNTSLTKINGSSLSGVANGVDKLSRSMQGLKGVGAVDYSRLARGIEKIAGLDSGQISRAANSLNALGKGLEKLNSVSMSGSSKNIEELAKGISRLGYTSSEKAIKNIPLLSKAMRDLMQDLSKAPKVSQNLIDMTNALAKLSRTGASSGKAATSLSRSLDTYTKSTSRASAGTKGLASAFGKMYASYWLIFRGISKLGDAIDLSSSLTEVENVVNATFGDYTDKIESLADVSISNYGMSELTAKTIASRFQAMGTAVGFAQGQMADMSVELTKLAADMSSFYNVSQEDVARSLWSVFTGEQEPLRKYGLDLTYATLQEWALNRGMEVNMYTMSQMEKVMLRYQYVMENTKAAQGDFLLTLDSWANRLRVLQEQFKAFGTVVGTGLIAAFKPFLRNLNTVMNHVIDFSETVLNALGAIFGWKFEITPAGVPNDLAGEMADAALDTGDAAGNAGKLSDNIGQAAKNAKKLHSVVLGIDELNINAPDTGTSGGSGSGGSGGSGGGSGTGSGSGSGLNTTMTRNDTILKAYESSIDSLYELGEYIGDTLTNVLNDIDWDKVYEGARNFGTGLANFLNGLISPELFGAVGRTIAGALNSAIYAALSFGETFDWKDFGLSIATGINEFFRTFDFGALAQTINVWVKGIFNTIITGLRNVEWGMIGEKIGEFLNEIDISVIMLRFAEAIWEALNSGLKLYSKMFSTAPIETALISLVGIPKALKAITSTKYIKGIGNLASYFGDFAKEVKNSGSFMATLKKRGSEVTSKMSKLQKATIGVTAVFGEFSLVKDGFYDIASGADNLVASLGKIVIGAGAAATALKLIGLSNPVTAAITGVTALVGAIVGVNQALEEQERILEEQEQIKLYGDTVANIVEETKQSSEALRERMEVAQEYVENAGIAETAMASDLAGKYFDLAEKENLTNDEKAEMQRLAQLLIEQFPELEQYYNSETKLIDTTRDSVQKLIDERLREIQLNAVEEKLTEAYKDRVDVMQDVAEAADQVNTGQETLNELEEKYQDLVDKQDLLAQYDELSQKINNSTGDTTDLIEEQQELWNELTNGGTEDFPTFESLSTAANEAYQELEDFRKEYGGIIDSFEIKNEDLNDINSSIEQLTGMLTSGMTSAAENSAEGFSKALTEDTLMGDASYNAALDAVDAFNEGQGAHSPATKFIQSGRYSIEGYVLGLESYRGRAVETARGIAISVISALNSSISKSSGIALTLPDSFRTAWGTIKNIFSPAPGFFESTFMDAYNKVKLAFGFVDSYFHEKWDSVKNVFKDVKPFFKGAFESAYNAITSAFSGISGFFKGIANKIVDPIKEAINGVIRGMNWLLNEVGAGKSISLWTAPTFANGTDGIGQDTFGIVNDQKGNTYKELIVPPSGKPFIPEGRNVMLPLEKGTKIMPADETKAFLNSIPRFAKGIGDFFGSAWKSVSGYKGSVLDYLNDPKGILQIATDKYTNVSGWKGIFGDMAAYSAKTLVDNAVGYIQKIFDEMLVVKYNPSAGVEQWRKLAETALRMTGQFSESNLDLLLYQMQTESGGNPNAINDWDINAQNGTPSKGLMQVIDPTFKSYAYPGYDTNIWDPLSNMLAAIRYTLSRYGSLANGWKGHGYASGIGTINWSDLIPAYSVGGFPEDGLFMANHNELVGQFSNGRTAVANNENIQQGIKEGVKEAVAELLAPYLQQIAQNTRETADKELSVNIGDREIAQANSRGTRRMGYSFTG